MPSNSQQDRRANILTAIIVLVVVFVVGSVIYANRSGNGSGPAPSSSETVALAECLTQKGAKMYGAYWCAHCKEQKQLFGSAFEKIDYVECSAPGNPQQQSQACKDADVSSYPTWVFADQSRKSGAIPLQELADQTGCPFGASPEVNAPGAAAAIQPAAAEPSTPPTPPTPPVPAPSY